MADLNFVAIVTGPEEYLEKGATVERFSITWDDILDAVEDLDDEGTPSEEEVVDAIQYLKEEYVAEWEQKFCRAIILTEEQFAELKTVNID